MRYRWIGFVLNCFPAWMLLLMLEEMAKTNWKKWIAWMIVLLFPCITALYQKECLEESKTAFQEELAREIDFRQVARGQNYFYARVEIIYKNGELDEVKLVPNSTTNLETER